MIVWRLIKERYRDTPLSALGALREGGRWNDPGVELLYCSESLSLASLEVFVHLVPAHRSIRFLALQIDIPDKASMTIWNDGELPEGWKTLEGNTKSRAKGTQWARGCAALVLSVPSVIVPEERNLILNTAHPEFKKVRVARSKPFFYDERLWKAPTSS